MVRGAVGRAVEAKVDPRAAETRAAAATLVAARPGVTGGDRTCTR